MLAFLPGAAFMRSTIPAAACPPRALDVESMRAGELKALLSSKGVSIDSCFDKSSLVERAMLYRDLLIRPETPDLPSWLGADPVEQGPQDAAASLILLHGFGDSGGGFISSVGGPLIAMTGLRVSFPSAPRVTMGGFPVSSWLDPPTG
jgi:hypothetical protein